MRVAPRFLPRTCARCAWRALWIQRREQRAPGARGGAPVRASIERGTQRRQRLACVATAPARLLQGTHRVDLSCVVELRADGVEVGARRWRRGAQGLRDGGQIAASQRSVEARGGRDAIARRGRAGGGRGPRGPPMQGHHSVPSHSSAKATVASAQACTAPCTNGTWIQRCAGSPAFPEAGAGADAATPAPPGETCTARSGTVAVRAAPASTSHHGMRGPGTRRTPAREGTTENLRTTRTCGRPCANDSSTCGGSANTCAPSMPPSCSSGNCVALAPSMRASTVMLAASPARAACGVARYCSDSPRSGSHGCGALAGTARTCSVRGAPRAARSRRPSPNRSSKKPPTPCPRKRAPGIASGPLRSGTSR